MTYQPTQYQQVLRIVSDRIKSVTGRYVTDEELGMAMTGRQNQTVAEVEAEFERLDQRMARDTLADERGHSFD